MAALILQQQSRVTATEIIRPTKPKRFTYMVPYRKVCQL